MRCVVVMTSSSGGDPLEVPFTPAPSVAVSSTFLTIIERYAAGFTSARCELRQDGHTAVLPGCVAHRTSSGWQRGHGQT